MPIQAPNEKPGDPAGARFGIDGLRPVERGGRIRQFAGAVIERPWLRPTPRKLKRSTEKPRCAKRVVALVDDLVIHRAVKLRMRMQDHGDRRILLLRRMIAAFEAAAGPVKMTSGIVILGKSSAFGRDLIPRECGGSADQASLGDANGARELEARVLA
jgi:hypothetical protein